MRHDGIYFLNGHSQPVCRIPARGTECKLAPWDFTVATAFNHDWVNFIPPRIVRLRHQCRTLGLGLSQVVLTTRILFHIINRPVEFGIFLGVITCFAAGLDVAKGIALLTIGILTFRIVTRSAAQEQVVSLRTPAMAYLWSAAKPPRQPATRW